MRPVLFLDVDGVLNVVGPDLDDEGRTVLLSGGHPFHPTPYVRPFMEWAWEEFEVVWNTAWRRGANAIADWAGLPRVPAIDEGPTYRRRQKRLAGIFDARQYLKAQGDWKVDGAREYLAGRKIPVFWLEDGLSDHAHRWIASRPRTHYLASDSFEGVTPAHRKVLEALVRHI